jgi:hypothetical protein
VQKDGFALECAKEPYKTWLKKYKNLSWEEYIKQYPENIL